MDRDICVYLRLSAVHDLEALRMPHGGYETPMPTCEMELRGEHLVHAPDQLVRVVGLLHQRIGTGTADGRFQVGCAVNLGPSRSDRRAVRGASHTLHDRRALRLPANHYRPTVSPRACAQGHHLLQGPHGAWPLYAGKPNDVLVGPGPYSSSLTRKIQNFWPKKVKVAHTPVAITKAMKYLNGTPANVSLPSKTLRAPVLIATFSTNDMP